MNIVSTPRVTVLMTVYNGARYIDEALDSILAEEFTDFELIIVDDGSNDATPEIIARAAARDRRIVLLTNETNLGIPAASNRGLAIARAEFIARLDADDISLPGRLAREVAVLEAHPDVAMVSMNYESIDAHGTVLGQSDRAHPPAIVEYLLNFSNAVGGHSQVMFRRSVVEAVGGYDESHAASLDYDLWARMFPYGRIVVLPQLGMRYRVHNENATTRDRKRQIEVGQRIAKRSLSTWLGRTLSDEEVLALTHSWSPLLPAIDAKLANKILREAYRVFCERESNPQSRRLVKKIKARRLVNTATVLFANGDPGNAIRHGLLALRWQPWSAIARMLARLTLPAHATRHT